VIKFKVYRKILLVGRDLGEDLQQKLKRRARDLQIHMPISAKKGEQIVMVNAEKSETSRHFSLINEEEVWIGGSSHRGYSL
jgi:16S rRNA C1402 (ribose-2'-O) methylase RsmI